MNNIARRESDSKGARVTYGQRSLFEEGDSPTYMMDEGYYRAKGRGPVEELEAEQPEPQISLSTIMAVFVSQSLVAGLHQGRLREACNHILTDNQRER